MRAKTVRTKKEKPDYELVLPTKLQPGDLLEALIDCWEKVIGQPVVDPELYGNDVMVRAGHTRLLIAPQTPCRVKRKAS